MNCEACNVPPYNYLDLDGDTYALDVNNTIMMHMTRNYEAYSSTTHHLNLPIVLYPPGVS